MGCKDPYSSDSIYSYYSCGWVVSFAGCYTCHWHGCCCCREDCHWGSSDCRTRNCCYLKGRFWMRCEPIPGFDCSAFAYAGSCLFDLVDLVFLCCCCCGSAGRSASSVDTSHCWLVCCCFFSSRGNSLVFFDLWIRSFGLTHFWE